MHAHSNIAQLSLASTLLGRVLRTLADLPAKLLSSKASAHRCPAMSVKSLATQPSPPPHRQASVSAPLRGVPGKAGIIITENDVELRLCGTELIGTHGSHDGIVVHRDTTAPSEMAQSANGATTALTPCEPCDAS